jgi:hypothetical protein
MTVLRRAPREVYRVYSEDEFLTRSAEDQDLEFAAGASAARRPHWVVGTTMLLAAAGVVWGLIALTGFSSVTGTRRRIGTGLLDTGGAHGALSRPAVRVVRAHVSRKSARAVVSRDRGAMGREASRARVTRFERPPVAPSTIAIVVRDRSVPVGAPTQLGSDHTDAATPRSAAAATEFGFER